MRLLLTVGSLLLASPSAAQVHPLPVPRPATSVWAAPSTPVSYPTDTVRATTGAGPGTWIGAGAGAAAGWFLTGAGCALAEKTTCGMPQLLGLVLGGLSGAMIGSALEGDQPRTGH